MPFLILAALGLHPTETSMWKGATSVHPFNASDVASESKLAAFASHRREASCKQPETNET